MYALILKLIFSAFFLVTSLYCLLAFLPYTFHALIKAPPHAWIPWFAQHHAPLFCVASLAGAIAWRDAASRMAYRICFGILSLVGIFLLIHPLLAKLESNQTAYWSCLVALWIPCAVAGLRSPKIGSQTQFEESNQTSHLSYLTGLGSAAVLAVLGAMNSMSSTPKEADTYLLIWSVMVHLLVAIMVVSIVNLILLASRKSPRKRTLRLWLYGGLLVIGLCVLLLRVLQTALDFDGWAAYAYAVSLAQALVLCGFALRQPFVTRGREESGPPPEWHRTVLLLVVAVFALAAQALSSLLRENDWNGVFQSALTLGAWIVFASCVFKLLPAHQRYSARSLIAIPALSLLAYVGLVTSDFVWAWPLGDSHADIQRTLETYADRDASFNLAYRLLGNRGDTPCSELCRTMLRHTEIRDAQARVDLNLVDTLVPSRKDRPNIFLFVIDSLRPDYIGAYNQSATFTPYLNALARDGIALRNVFTNYGGTSLSEPAIWAGALLLHSHYLRPFERVNSLEKLLKTDGYKMIVSNDEVLSDILAPSEDIVRLDTETKLWTNLEICSTIKEAENVLAHRADNATPVFFYTQPKNVHQFAGNSLPKANEANWPPQPGFNHQLSLKVHQVDTCIGGFIAWLKEHRLYDDSIIIVTSDHGDATGELGRRSHSVVIYPEIMRVPLIVHLPVAMQHLYRYDDDHLSALIDITPSLYYLLGHRSIVSNPIFGHPLFVETEEEILRYRREDLFFASDAHAIYGILADNGRYFYATYASPPKSYLYDLIDDPKGVRDVLSGTLKRHYDERILEYLQEIASFYGYTF